MTQNRHNRRGFLRQSTLAATTALTVGPFVVSRAAPALGKAPGANERVGIGYIGCGRRAGQLRELPANAQVVGVADCNIARAKQWGDKYKCKAYQDYRKLLERKDLHGVIIATPDHWHALHTIYAAMAGKDVYCEKPVNLTIAEGQAMVHAVRKYKCIFQAGSQQRSDTYCRGWLRAGSQRCHRQDQDGADPQS